MKINQKKTRGAAAPIDIQKNYVLLYLVSFK